RLLLRRQEGVQELLVDLDLAIRAHLGHDRADQPLRLLPAERIGELCLLRGESRGVSLRAREHPEENESRRHRDRRPRLPRRRLEDFFEKARGGAQVGHRTLWSELRSRLHLGLVALGEIGERGAGPELFRGRRELLQRVLLPSLRLPVLHDGRPDFGKRLDAGRTLGERPDESRAAGSRDRLRRDFADLERPRFLREVSVRADSRDRAALGEPLGRAVCHDVALELASLLLRLRLERSDLARELAGHPVRLGRRLALRELTRNAGANVFEALRARGGLRGQLDDVVSVSRFLRSAHLTRLHYEGGHYYVRVHTAAAGG